MVDNDAAAHELRAQLTALGYDSFSHAANGEAASAMAKQARPDVVLIDTDLLGQASGEATAQTILSQHSLPVIFLSTSVSIPAGGASSAGNFVAASADKPAGTPEETLDTPDIAQFCRTILKPFSLRELDALIELAVYKHQSEAKLKRSQERLRLSRLGSLDGVWEWDLINNDIYCSPRWYEILGYGADEIAPPSNLWQEITHPDDLPDASLFIARTMKSNALSYEREVRLRHKDGHYVPVLVRAVIVRDSARWATRMGGTITDLTDRKRMEAELDVHRHFAAQIINTMGQGISVTNTDGRLEFVNPALARLFNCNVTDLIGKREDELFVPDDAAVIAEHRAARWAGKTSTYESRVKRADGSIAPVEITGVPRMQNGKFNGSIAVVVDLTNRKQAELALRNSADFSAALAESVPDKLGYWNTDLRCGFANKHYAEWYGRAAGEMHNISMQELLGERFQYNEAYARAALRGETGKAEFRVERNGGAAFDFLVQYLPHRVDGEVVGFFLTITDITALKFGQEKLRMVGAALEVVSQAVIITTPDMRIFSVNDAFTAVTGYSKDEVQGRTCEFLRGPLTDTATIGALEEAAMNGVEFSCELLNYRKNGSAFWLELTTSPVRDELLRITHYVAVMIDITRRRARDLERETERKVLEAVAAGGSLASLLAAVIGNYERQFEGMRGSILLLDSAGQHLLHCAAPSLPQAYCDEIDGIAIGLGVGSCGTAAASGKTVIVSDIAQNDLWQDYREIALGHGLRACWSVPILGTAGKVLGTFAFYFSEPRDALASELLMIERGAQLASLAIERHLANTALSDSEQRYRALVEWSPEAIVVYRNGRFIYVNPAFVKLTGAASPQQLIGTSLIDFVHPASKLMVAQRMQTMLKGEAVAPVIEFKGMTFDGGVVEVETQGTPIVFDGEPAVHVVVRDLTARNQAEVARSVLESQLRESQKMEAIGTLAGGIAHDFNNILATILGNADLANQDAANNPQTIESLNEIRKAGIRARALVQQILSFSRRQPTERKRVDLKPVIEESARLLRSTLPAGLSLEVRCAPSLPMVMADATQIQQVVINLATNAMHAIQACRRKAGCIDIQLDSVVLDAVLAQTHPALSALFRLHPGRTVRLSVIDNGLGMDAATVNRIFEPFFTTKPVDEGTGLGLSVVHGIANSHEGAIVVESTPDRGSTFYLYLPVVDVPVVDLPVVDVPASTASRALREPEAARSASAPTKHAAEVGSHILYIDDDESLVFLLKRLLERRGLRISAYLDQAEALDALRADPDGFDLLVSDYNMPGMSGLEVASEARAIRADLPVAIASGFIDETLRAGAEGAGVRELIFKASAVEDLCDAFVRLAHTAAQNRIAGKSS